MAEGTGLVPGLTAPSPDVVFGDVYLSWNQGVYLATIAMDYYDPELLAFGETFPLGEAFHIDWGIDAGAGPQRLVLYMVPPKEYRKDRTRAPGRTSVASPMAPVSPFPRR